MDQEHLGAGIPTQNKVTYNFWEASIYRKQMNEQNHFRYFLNATQTELQESEWEWAEPRSDGQGSLPWGGDI